MVEHEAAPVTGEIVDLPEDGAPAPVKVDDGTVVLREDAEVEEPLPRRAVVRQDGSVELPLLHPVTMNWRIQSTGATRPETIDRLVLHRLNGTDMRAISAASNAASVVVALARSARIPEGKFGPIFDRMDGQDVNDAGQIVGRFLGNGRRTGP